MSDDRNELERSSGEPPDRRSRANGSGRSLLTGWSLDLRHAARGVRKTPGLWVMAAVSLALGIGANTAVLSVIRQALLEPLPYHQPREIVQVLESQPELGPNWTGSVSVPNLRDWAERSQSFDGMAAWSYSNVNLTTTDEALRLRGAALGPEIWSILEVPARLGQTFGPGSDLASAPPVAVLSDGLWRSRFASDPSVVGQEIRLNGQPATVVGVMPPAFDFPPQSDSEIWIPLVVPEDLVNARGSHWYPVLARLADGTSIDQAQAEMVTIAEAIEREYPETQEGRSAVVQDFTELFRGRNRPMLLTVLAAAFLLLLVGCTNVTNLFLTRASVRGREFALRSALGAGRWQLLRHAWVESTLLAVISGPAGYLLGLGVLRGIAQLPGNQLPIREGLTPEPLLLLVVLVLSWVACIGCGMLPGLRASDRRLSSAIGGATRASTSRDPVRSGLVIAEVALSMMVLIGGTLTWRSAQHLAAVDPGFDREEVLTFRLPLSTLSYPEDAAVNSFYDSLLERIAALPGVDAAGAISHLPLAQWGYNGNISVEGYEAERNADQPFAEFRVVTPDYFEAMGIPVLEGETFASAGGLAGQSVMFNHSFVDRYWPGRSALGRGVNMGGDEPLPVLGVAADIRNIGLHREPRPELYIPFELAPHHQMSVMVRAQVEPLSLVPAIRDIVRELDPDQPIYSARTMQEVFEAQIAGRRSFTFLLMLVGSMALILTLMGLYSVISHIVTMRRREIGIRLALGSGRQQIVGLFLRQGLGMTLIGLAVGVALSLATARLLGSRLAPHLYEIGPYDPTSYAVIALALAAIATLACWLPSRRSLQVDPPPLCRKTPEVDHDATVPARIAAATTQNSSLQRIRCLMLSGWGAVQHRRRRCPVTPQSSIRRNINTTISGDLELPATDEAAPVRESASRGLKRGRTYSKTL